MDLKTTTSITTITTKQQQQQQNGNQRGCDSVEEAMAIWNWLLLNLPHTKRLFELKRSVHTVNMIIIYYCCVVIGK